MSVTGYLALYTTLIGWQQYQKLWDLMVGTGIVFIPFIGIVLQCFLEPFESQEPKSAAVVTLRRLLIRVIGALLIIEFCCVPTIHLEPKVLHFEPMCVANPKIATPGNTGTTYDNQFKVPTGVKVPILWYLVMAISNGFTHAAIHSVSCSPINYQRLQSQLDLSHITSAPLKKETVQFYNDCYVPSYSKYLSNDLSESQKSQLQTALQQYGKQDIAWIGSHAFQLTQGFYQTQYAREPIPGFVFDANRDQFSGQINNHSKWGQPNCKVWWTDPTQGLHARLQKALPASFIDDIQHVVAPQGELADIGIRQLIKHSFDPGMSISDINQGYQSLNSSRNLSGFSELGADIGVVVHQLKYYPTMYLLLNALPVIQALLLLVIYALLALVIPFSSYRLQFIITGSAIIFAITFWSYLWHLIGHINNLLIGALYVLDHDQSISSWQAYLSNTDSSNISAIFVEFIIGSAYVVLPLLLLVLMTWAGIKVSTHIAGSIQQMAAASEASGAISGDLVKRGIMAYLMKK